MLNLLFYFFVELFSFIQTMFLLPFAMPLLSPVLKASVRERRQNVERELNSFWTIKRCWKSDKLIEIVAVSLDIFLHSFHVSLPYYSFLIQHWQSGIWDSSNNCNHLTECNSPKLLLSENCRCKPGSHLVAFFLKTWIELNLGQTNKLHRASLEVVYFGLLPCVLVLRSLFTGFVIYAFLFWIISFLHCLQCYIGYNFWKFLLKGTVKRVGINK